MGKSRRSKGNDAQEWIPCGFAEFGRYVRMHLAESLPPAITWLKASAAIHAACASASHVLLWL